MCGCNFLSNEWGKVLLAKPILQFYWTRTSEIYSETQITWSHVKGERKGLAEARGQWERRTLLCLLFNSQTERLILKIATLFHLAGNLTKQNWELFCHSVGNISETELWQLQTLDNRIIVINYCNKCQPS